MKQVEGIWLPDDEERLVDFLRRSKKVWPDEPGSYQRAMWMMCQRVLEERPPEERRWAIDVGAHVGLWSTHLAKFFEGVLAFEPVHKFAECWHANMAGVQNAKLVEVGLGQSLELAHFIVEPGNSGATRRNQRGKSMGLVLPLDALELDGLDFIKMDVEGWELDVLKGAEQTLQSYRPVVCIEQKDHKRIATQYEALEMLKGWGMRVRIRVVDDWILDWGQQ